MKRKSGFTAIELLVVVAVIATLAVLVAPSMRDLIDRRRLIKQAEDLANLVQLARSEAIRHSGGGVAPLVGLTIQPGTNWYLGLSNGTAACDGSAAGCAVNQGGTQVTRLISAGDCGGCTISAPATQKVITFNFRGLATSSTDSDITLASPRGRQITLRISRIGRTFLCSPNASVTGYPEC